MYWVRKRPFQKLEGEYLLATRRRVRVVVEVEVAGVGTTAVVEVG